MKNSKLLFLALFVIACNDGGFEALKNTRDGLNCKIRPSGFTPKLQTAYERESQKVVFLNNRSQSVFPKDFEVSVLIDRECVYKTTGLSFLTKEARKLPKRDFKKYSKQEAFTVKLPVQMSKLELEKIASKDACVVGLTEETYAQLQAIPNDPLFNNQSYMPSIRYTEIYDDVFTSAKKLTGEYVVAVIDTGYLMNHPDLVNRYWVNADEIPGNNIDDDNNGVIDDVNGANQNSVPPMGNPSSVNYAQHGTHVAGFIGAQLNNSEGVSGIMGANARIMAINAWPALVSPVSGGNPPMSAVDRSIRYAVDNGARVINISMQANEYHPNIEAAMIYAAERNVVVVVAAGNYASELGDDKYIGAPAIYTKDIPGAISVAATNSANGNTNPSACQFTNYSTSYVEIAAPGCDSNTYTSYGGNGILSCVPTSTDPSGYGYIQGTSMASPVAAAGAMYTYALLKELAGLEPTAALVEEVMREGSAVNPNLQLVTAGAKHLDLKSIYDYVQRRFIDRPEPTPPEEDCKLVP